MNQKPIACDMNGKKVYWNKNSYRICSRLSRLRGLLDAQLHLHREERMCMNKFQLLRTLLENSTANFSDKVGTCYIESYLMEYDENSSISRKVPGYTFQNWMFFLLGCRNIVRFNWATGEFDWNRNLGKCGHGRNLIWYFCIKSTMYVLHRVY